MGEAVFERSTMAWYTTHVILKAYKKVLLEVAELPSAAF
jgi:hypothetical protein